MRLLTTISIFLVWSLGLIHPGVWSNSFDLHKMYQHCADEDLDIDPADFVVEHLLNLEDLLDYLEGEADEHEEGERPHQPYRAAQYSSGSFVALPGRNLYQPQNSIVPLDEVVYLPERDKFYQFSFLADIFHPPAVRPS